MPRLAALLDASHASLRDDYEVSTPAVEATRERMLRGRRRRARGSWAAASAARCWACSRPARGRPPAPWLSGQADPARLLAT